MFGYDINEKIINFTLGFNVSIIVITFLLQKELYSWILWLISGLFFSISNLFVFFPCNLHNITSEIVISLFSVLYIFISILLLYKYIYFKRKNKNENLYIRKIFIYLFNKTIPNKIKINETLDNNI